MSQIRKYRVAGVLVTPETREAKLKLYKVRINNKEYDLDESEFNNILDTAKDEMLSKGGIRSDRVDDVIQQFRTQAQTGVYDFNVGNGSMLGGKYEGESEDVNLGGKKRVTGWNKLWNNEKNEQTIMSSLNYHFGSHAGQYANEKDITSLKLALEKEALDKLALEKTSAEGVSLVKDILNGDWSIGGLTYGGDYNPADPTSMQSFLPDNHFSLDETARNEKMWSAVRTKLESIENLDDAALDSIKASDPALYSKYIKAKDWWNQNKGNASRALTTDLLKGYTDAVDSWSKDQYLYNADAFNYLGLTEDQITLKKLEVELARVAKEEADRIAALEADANLPEAERDPILFYDDYTSTLNLGGIGTKGLSHLATSENSFLTQLTGHTKKELEGISFNYLGQQGAAHVFLVPKKGETEKIGINEAQKYEYAYVNPSTGTIVRKPFDIKDFEQVKLKIALASSFDANTLLNTLGKERYSVDGVKGPMKKLNAAQMLYIKHFMFEDGGILKAQDGTRIVNIYLDQDRKNYIKKLQEFGKFKDYKSAENAYGQLVASGKIKENVVVLNTPETLERKNVDEWHSQTLLKSFDEGLLSATDKMDLASIGFDLASIIAGFSPGAAGGLQAASAVTTFGADVARDGLDIGDVGFGLFNLGTLAVSLIPGVGSAIGGIKAFKALTRLLKPLHYALTAAGLLGAANIVYKGVAEGWDKVSIQDMRHLVGGLAALKSIHGASAKNPVEKAKLPGGQRAIEFEAPSKTGAPTKRIVVLDELELASINAKTKDIEKIAETKSIIARKIANDPELQLLFKPSLTDDQIGLNLNSSRTGRTWKKPTGEKTQSIQTEDAVYRVLDPTDPKALYLNKLSTEVRLNPASRSEYVPNESLRVQDLEFNDKSLNQKTGTFINPKTVEEVSELTKTNKALAQTLEELNSIKTKFKNIDDQLAQIATAKTSGSDVKDKIKELENLLAEIKKQKITTADLKDAHIGEVKKFEDLVSEDLNARLARLKTLKSTSSVPPPKKTVSNPTPQKNTIKKPVKLPQKLPLKQGAKAPFKHEEGGILKAENGTLFSTDQNTRKLNPGNWIPDQTTALKLLEAFNNARSIKGQDSSVKPLILQQLEEVYPTAPNTAVMRGEYDAIHKGVRQNLNLNASTTSDAKLGSSLRDSAEKQISDSTREGKYKENEIRQVATDRLDAAKALWLEKRNLIANQNAANANQLSEQEKVAGNQKKGAIAQQWSGFVNFLAQKKYNKQNEDKQINTQLNQMTVDQNFKTNNKFDLDKLEEYSRRNGLGEELTPEDLEEIKKIQNRLSVSRSLSTRMLLEAIKNNQTLS